MNLSDSLQNYFFISVALFSLGVFGLLMRRNLVAMLISLELVLNSASLNFIAINRFCLPDKSLGQVFTIFIVALAAAEVCIALSLVLWLYRKKESINIDEATELKG
jgi:NADH:ubiquinone oxidoreductase subunit K